MYPGSFDPLHLGHIDVIEQAHELFGDVVVAVMHNHAKVSGLFPVAQRIELAEQALAHLDGVTVEAQTGLAVQAAANLGVDFIVKGLRRTTTPSQVFAPCTFRALPGWATSVAAL